MQSEKYEIIPTKLEKKNISYVKVASEETTYDEEHFMVQCETYTKMPDPDSHRDIDTLIERINVLEQENAQLRQILHENGIPIPNKRHSIPSAMRRLSVQEKIDLFTSLFQGRTDVFARRWCSTSTGKSGYQPVCRNEWVTGLCDKKKYKCADCPNREFEPLTAEHLYRHLEGKDALARDVLGLRYDFV